MIPACSSTLTCTSSRVVWSYSVIREVREIWKSPIQRTMCGKATDGVRKKPNHDRRGKRKNRINNNCRKYIPDQLVPDSVAPSLRQRNRLSDARRRRFRKPSGGRRPFAPGPGCEQSIERDRQPPASSLETYYWTERKRNGGKGRWR